MTKKTLQHLHKACMYAGLQLLANEKGTSIRIAKEGWNPKAQKHMLRAKGLKLKDAWMLRTTTWSISFWEQGEIDELELLIYHYADGLATWSKLYHYQDSMRICEQGYVVDSYRYTHDRLIDIIQNCFEVRGYTQSMMSKFYMPVEVWEKTSAVLVGSYYITPCMVKTCIEQVLKQFDKDRLIELARMIEVKPKLDLMVKLISDATFEEVKSGIDEHIYLDCIDLVRGI